MTLKTFIWIADKDAVLFLSDSLENAKHHVINHGDMSKENIVRELDSLDNQTDINELDYQKHNLQESTHKRYLTELRDNFKELLGNDFMGIELRDGEITLSTTLLHDYIVQHYIGNEYKVIKMLYEEDDEDYSCRTWLISKK